MASRNFLASQNHEPTEALLEHIDDTDVPDHNLLVRAVMHPDERVPIAAIQRWKSSIGRRGRWNLFVRSIRTSQLEKIAWHPLFDAMASHSCWPWKDELDPVWYARHRPDEATIEYRIRPLAAWLETQPDPTTIEPLLRFQAYPVLFAIGQHAGMINEDLAHRLPLPALAQNPRLPESLVPWVAQGAVDLLTNSSDSISARQIPARFGLNPIPYAVHTLKHLAASSRRIPAKLIDRLAEGVGGTLGRGCAWALSELGAQVGVEHLEKALRHSRNQENWKWLAAHPSATSTFRCELLRTADKSTRQELRRELSKHLGALADPNVRELVLEPTNEPVLNEQILKQALATAAEADDEVFLDVLRRFIGVAPLIITGALAERGEEIEGMHKWEGRIREKHLDELIDCVVCTNDPLALSDLLWYQPTANNPRLHDAIVRHPRALDDDLYRLLTITRGETFRRVFRRLTQRTAPECLKDLLVFLATKQPAGLVDLLPSDLAPLLQSKHNEIRIRAITLLVYI